MNSKYGFLSDEEEEQIKRTEREGRERELQEQRKREHEEWKRRHDDLRKASLLHDAYIRDVLNDYLNVKLRDKSLPFKITGPTTHFLHDWGSYNTVQESDKNEGQEFPYAEWVGRIGNLEMGIDRLTGEYHTHRVAAGRHLDLCVRLVFGMKKTYFRIIQWNEYGNNTIEMGDGSREGLVSALRSFRLNTIR